MKKKDKKRKVIQLGDLKYGQIPFFGNETSPDRLNSERYKILFVNNNIQKIVALTKEEADKLLDEILLQ